MRKIEKLSDCFPKLIHILSSGGPYEVGSMPPDGYIQREEWWHAHKKGGLKQVQC